MAQCTCGGKQGGYSKDDYGQTDAGRSGEALFEKISVKNMERIFLQEASNG
jgi:hypothetical protein